MRDAVHLDSYMSDKSILDNKNSNANEVITIKMPRKTRGKILLLKGRRMRCEFFVNENVRFVRVGGRCGMQKNVVWKDLWRKRQISYYAAARFDFARIDLPYL